MAINLVVPEDRLQAVELLGFEERASTRRDRLYLGALKALGYGCSAFLDVAPPNFDSHFVIYTPETRTTLPVRIYPFEGSDTNNMEKGYMDPLLTTGLKSVPKLLEICLADEGPEEPCGGPLQPDHLPEAPEIEIRLTEKNEDDFNGVLQGLQFFDSSMTHRDLLILTIDIAAGIRPWELMKRYLAVEKSEWKKPRIKRTDDYSPD